MHDVVRRPHDGDSQVSPFDAIKRIDDDGEHWLGRELCSLMAYGRYIEFTAVIEKAKESLALIQGVDQADHHFGICHTDGGRWGNQQLDDYRLTRFGAYLTAMAGDDQKPAVAQARVYFAVQTRTAEVAQDAELPDLADPLAELERQTDLTRRAIELAREERQQRELEQARAVQAEQNVLTLMPLAERDVHRRGREGERAIGDFANDLKQWAQENLGIRVRHQQVWKFLGQLGLIIRGNTVRHNHPTAFAITHGYLVGRESTPMDDHGDVHLRITPRLTPKGEGYVWDRAVHRLREDRRL